MVSNTTAGSNPGRTWWYIDMGMDFFSWMGMVGMVVQYNSGVRLLPGYHMFGAFQVKERRIIQKSLLEMMGFNPVCMHAHFFLYYQLTIYTDIYGQPIDISW